MLPTQGALVQDTWSAALFVSLIVALIGLTGVASGILQRAINDRREQWWKRAEWAMTKAVDEKEHVRTVALCVLLWLAKSRIARQEERDMIEGVADHVLQGVHEDAL